MAKCNNTISPKSDMCELPNFIYFLHNPPTNLTADGGGVYKLFYSVAFFRSANSKILQAFQMMRPQAIDIISPTTYLTLQFCFKEDN